MTPAPLTRRGALAGGLGLAAGALLAACSDDDTGTAGPSGDSNELVVGINLELTGQGSTFGKLQEQAVKVAAEQFNADGMAFGTKDLRIRLVIKDNGGDPEEAGALVKELIDQDKVSAIIGGTLVETASAMLAVAEARKVPLLCLNSGDDISVPLPLRRFIYQLGPNPSDVSAIMANRLRREKLTKVSVLAAADGHGEAGVRALPRALRAASRELGRTTRLPRSGKAFASAANRTVDGNPDAVIIWAQAPYSAAAVAAVKAAGFKGRILLDPGAGADETLEGANGDAMEGTYLVHPTVMAGAPLITATPSDRAARDFIYRYIQQYGAFNGFAPYAADALNLVVTAARRAVSLDPLRLRGRLEGGAVEGITGAYEFGPISHGGLVPDALTLFTVRSRTWIRLT